jgi:uncharacterized membrane protein
MTETGVPPVITPPVTTPGVDAEPLTVPTIVYVLYGVGFFVPPAALVGVIMAHTGSSTAGPIARTHFAYQTRTFWYGLLMLIVACGLGMSYAVVNLFAMMAETPEGGEFVLPEGVPPVLIVSGLIFLWWLIWTLVRCIKGFVTLLSRHPMPKPTTLLW